MIRSILKRVMKLIVRIVLYSLLLIFLFLAILHIPATQNKITTKVSEFLSNKTGGEISIDELKFSIFGSVGLHGLEVIDPLNEHVLSANSIAIEFYTSGLLLGNLVFKQIQVQGLKGQLIQNKEVLNIQFILDAFKLAERNQESSPYDPLESTLRIIDIDLRGIHFKFQSLDKDIEFQTSLGSLNIEGADLNINPNRLIVERLSLENTHLSLMTSRNSIREPKISDIGESNKLPFLDLNSGFDFDIGKLEIKDNSFSFHVDKTFEKLQFDPDHIEASNINIELANVLVREDSLSAEIVQIATVLPGFSVQEFKFNINANLKQLDLSGLYFTTKESHFEMDLKGQINHFPDLISEMDQAAFQFSLAGQLDQSDLFYFLGDSSIKHVRQWPAIQIEANTRYTSGSADIKEFDIGVGNSRLYVEGMLTNFQPGQKITWENLIINTTIGNEFKEPLSSFTGEINLPPRVRIKFNSSGQLEDFDLEGQVLTSWGTISSRGSAGINEKKLNMNMTLIGNKVRLGDFFNLSWLGSTDLSLQTRGQIGDVPEIDIEGTINRIDLFDQSIVNTNISSRIMNKTTSAIIHIEDPDYRSKIDANISFDETLNISGSLHLDQFRIGKLFHQDTSLQLTGDLYTKIRLDQPSIQGFLHGRNVALETAIIRHRIDSLTFDLESAPGSSTIEFYTDNINGSSETNFQIHEAPELFALVLRDYLMPFDSLETPKGNRNMRFDFKLIDATLLQLMDLDIKGFHELTLGGRFNENDQALEIEAVTQNFNGFGLSLDTMDLRLAAFSDSLNSSISIHNLYYDSTYLGDLELDIFNSDKTSYSDILLNRDSVYLAVIKSRLTKSEDDLYLFLDSLIAFNDAYKIDNNNPIIINKDNLSFNQFTIGREEMEMSLDGNLTNFDFEVKNLDLRRFNAITADSLINTGVLNSTFSFNKTDKQVNLNLAVDSLTLYEYPPVYISGKAINQGETVPFQMKLHSTTNNIDLGGNYNFENSTIDGSLFLDINDLEVFEFLAPNFLDKMGGKIMGEATVEGSLIEPELNGFLRLQDIRLITSNPKASINVQDEIIYLNNSGITFNDFTLYDNVHNPLIINGYINMSDYQSFEYDLDLATENYMLINSPQVNENRLQGILVIGSDIKMSGNNSGTFISADLRIKDSTDLSYSKASEDIEMVSSEGIVEFIDPKLSFDSTNTVNAQSYYDSLIANLPRFEVKAAVKLKENAQLRIILDPRSGDFLEASGTADLQVDHSRSGITRLTGKYSIEKGSYQLSFYDIVKKKFTIAPGSNVVWNGDPKTGKLDLTALYTFQTSSTGLVGHEVGENEKALYRRPLPYEVRIIIAGSIDNPDISFGLDLPQEDKNNYPALANKLSRLKQPEFESELNKQVFGLLVLGGFIPETSDSEINEGLVATTAISNSVSSILASQLNRFTSEYVKGVDIDVGMQSYSDFTTGSGQTRTSMVVRVSKRMVDDRLSFEIGGGMDISTGQSGPKARSDNLKGDVAITYDLTESGNKQLKAFNNETYDIIYHQVRNTGISLIFIREFDKKSEKK